MENLKEVLERIAVALEKQNQLMEAQEMRQRKLDRANFESLKKASVDEKRVIKISRKRPE
jgi:hypothetical protein